jgi:hypothetical protein
MHEAQRGLRKMHRTRRRRLLSSAGRGKPAVAVMLHRFRAREYRQCIAYMHGMHV